MYDGVENEGKRNACITHGMRVRTSMRLLRSVEATANEALRELEGFDQAKADELRKAMNKARAEHEKALEEIAKNCEDV